MASQTRQQTIVVSVGNWSNFTIAALAAQDGTNATNNVTAYTAGVLRGYGFAIPTGATVRGVQVNGYFSSSAANSTSFLRLRYSKDGGSSWSNYSAEQSTSGATAFSVGGETDLWGLTLSPSEVNSDTNFHLAVEGRLTDTNRQHRLDFIEVVVYYDEPATAPIAGETSLTFSNEATAKGRGKLQGESSLTFTVTGATALETELKGETGFSFQTSGALKGKAGLQVETTFTFVTTGTTKGKGRLAGSATIEFEARLSAFEWYLITTAAYTRQGNLYFEAAPKWPRKKWQELTFTGAYCYPGGKGDLK